jgi:hypothetical protein
VVGLILCPYDHDLPADQCCGTRLTDCCPGRKADCATAVVFDSNMDPDVVVCQNGHGCNAYAVHPAVAEWEAMTPSQREAFARDAQAQREKWSREDEDVTRG